jgi:hypothetical protein
VTTALLTVWFGTLVTLIVGTGIGYSLAKGRSPTKAASTLLGRIREAISDTPPGVKQPDPQPHKL